MGGAPALFRFGVRWLATAFSTRPTPNCPDFHASVLLEKGVSPGLLRWTFHLGEAPAAQTTTSHFDLPSLRAANSRNSGCSPIRQKQAPPKSAPETDLLARATHCFGKFGSALTSSICLVCRSLWAAMNKTHW